MRVRDLQKELATMEPDGRVWGYLGERGNSPVFHRLDYLTAKAFDERRCKLLSAVLPAWRRAFEAGGFHIEQSARDVVFAGRYVGAGYRVDVGASVASGECDARWCVTLGYPLGGPHVPGSKATGRCMGGPMDAMEAAVQSALDDYGKACAERLRQLAMNGQGKDRLTADERAALKAGVRGAKWNWEQARQCRWLAGGILSKACAAVEQEVGHE